MKVVLDTNVFISGIFFGGPPSRILEAWRDGELEIVVSRPIIDEYAAVGQRLSKRFPGVDPKPFLYLLALSAEVHRAPRLPNPVCEDPQDDKFIACALAGGSKIVVTGDKGMLRVSGYRGVRVVSPRRFVDEYLK